MNQMFKRVLFAALGVLILSYLIYHAFVVPYTSITTESVSAYTARDTISAENTYIIRSESVITSEQSGSFCYSVDSGDKVAANGTIANVYSSPKDVESIAKIASIDRQLDSLKSLQNYSTRVVVDVNQLKTQINDSLVSMLSSVQNGEFSSADTYAEDYLSLLNRRQAVTGGGTDFSEMISGLQKQRDALSASLNASAGTIAAPSAGYFVSKVDGYENVLNTEMVETITPDNFDSFKPESTDSNAVGKVVGDISWYIAAKISFEQALQFKEGDALTVEIPTSTVVSSLPVTVYKINKSVDKSDAVIIFSCDYMNNNVSQLRSPNVKFVLRSYDGLRISSEAIRVKNGKKGVYVSNGTSIKFTPVSVLYTGNGYVVCKKTDPLKNGLHDFDDVVVKGKNLYDGKMLD